uniref:Uncharacterized protein n=1 Tax=Anguilla anguilla TaxID=7936 RepID=A0A0E9Q1I2_ANGAN
MMYDFAMSCSPGENAKRCDKVDYSLFFFYWITKKRRKNIKFYSNKPKCLLRQYISHKSKAEN